MRELAPVNITHGLHANFRVNIYVEMRIVMSIRGFTHTRTAASNVFLIGAMPLPLQMLKQCRRVAKTVIMYWLSTSSMDKGFSRLLHAFCLTFARL